MAKKKTGSRHFGAFRGVFVPTFLTIIGVILFLRLGRIVSTAGMIGTILIILLAISITLCTGLSLSSVTSNIKIGSGGAFSILSKTLGLEIGGSVGIPLFIAQAFSVVLYVFGFSEAWNFIFPQHSQLLVVLGVFLIIFLLTFISIKYAIKAQIIVFGLVLLSLASIFMGGGWWNNIATTPILTDFSFNNFWLLFALFFPAATGLMAGVGMSGELTNPKKQIPKGVMYAIGITTAIYILTVLWLGHSATAQELATNNLIMVKLAAFAPLVLIGILAATFSSALTTFVAASRLLSAMAENTIFFFNSFFSEKSKSGEPRNATLFTSFIVITTLIFGSLDTVAPILTMIFLIAYAMINLVVFIEQTIGFVSFRPIFKIPKFVSLYGFVGSLFVMFYVNLISGIIAIIILFLVYLILVRRRLETKSGYVRSGLLLAISEWAAKKVISLSESKKQIWKPNILLPVISSRKLLGNFSIVKSLVYPNGELNILGIFLKKRKKIQGMKINKKKTEKERKAIPSLIDKFKKEGIFTSYASISVENYINGVCTSMEAMEGQFFKPNILFLPVSLKHLSNYELKRLFSSAKNAGSGMIIFDKNNDIGLGSQEDIHVWLSPKILKEEDLYEGRKYDLAMLSAYQLYRNWVGKITLRICVEKKNEDDAKRYLRKLITESRFPASTEIEVITDTFYQGLKESPRGDIHILPIANLSEIKKISKKTKKINKSFLFVVDSGNEDVLA